MSNYERDKRQPVRKSIIMFLLYFGSLMILFLGMFFCAFSMLNHIWLKVWNTSVPGVVFGLLIVYLGTRYYFMVDEFKKKLYAKDNDFSWSNFRKRKRSIV